MAGATAGAATGGSATGGASSGVGGGPSAWCDRDGDGYPSTACEGNDCNDGDAAIHPGAPDTNAVAGAWSSTGGTDCDDGDATVHRLSLDTLGCEL
jgi:hypothetical protein